jgi:protein tyrosine phosphatase (PTP) superfamily phosphohydrolase (DUF442 family)
MEKPGLHNLFRLSPRILSGSQPEGEAGFQSLKDLGVATIISVDGAAPDLAAAKAVGMRYVHLPIGYDGVPAETAARVAKAIRELPGPMYVHCHHGTHRGPAAAACAWRILDSRIDQETAEAFLRRVGTDPRYAGLWKSVDTAKPLSPLELDAIPADFPESSKVSDLATRMVQVDATWDLLKACAKAGWKSPPDHVDITPAHEALQLVEHFREAGRFATDPLKVRFTSAEGSANDLERALRTKADAATIETVFKKTGASCTDCHATHRDKK